LNLEGSESLKRISRRWGIKEEEAIENITIRAKLREMLVDLASIRGGEYLGPLWLIRSNEFLWGRIGQSTDPMKMSEGFEDWLSGRSGVEALS
jgi:hypothetical protein